VPGKLSVSDWKNVTCGVSQGSVLGTFLFVIFNNDLNKKIMNDSKLYADDTKVISIIKNLLDGNILQNDIKILVDWSNEWSIKFNGSIVTNLYF
jgi:hypothetical protein